MQLSITLFFIVMVIILLTLVSLQRKKASIKCIKSREDCKMKKVTQTNKKMKSHRKSL